MKSTLYLLLTSLLVSCGENTNNSPFLVFSKDKVTAEVTPQITYINPSGMTVQTRYNVPENYTRKTYRHQDFGYHLQQLPLKDYGKKVKYYNGKDKNTPQVYSSVVDLPIGAKDLHQCADAAMRLRADFLYQQKRYGEISFHFNDGQPRAYTDYVKGDYSTQTYWNYLEHIFMYANTSSLKQQLQSVPKNEVQIGDILLQSGTPYGHAVIVIDMAENQAGDRLVLLAQSYMPAQELQVLENPSSSDGNPWYRIDHDRIITPEWEFTSADWKTW